MSKHTQGPLRITRPLHELGGGHERNILRADGADNLILFHLGRGSGDTTIDADAALLVAAFDAATEVEMVGYDGEAVIKALPELIMALTKYLKLDNDKRSGCRISARDWADCHQTGMAALDKAREV